MGATYRLTSANAYHGANKWPSSWISNSNHLVEGSLATFKGQVTSTVAGEYPSSGVSSNRAVGSVNFGGLVGGGCGGFPWACGENHTCYEEEVTGFTVLSGPCQLDNGDACVTSGRYPSNREAVSEGVHWAEVMDPLVQYCSPWFALAFLCYIVFALFALLNVVTGLFVEAAIATATEDKKLVLMQQMCQMFLDCDDDQSGTVSWEEFKEHLDNPQMETYLKELDIDKAEAPMLFHLLDGDGSGEIEAEELVGGCLRLHGYAKALELAALHEFRQFGRMMATHAKCVEDALHVSSHAVANSLAPVSERSEEEED